MPQKAIRTVQLEENYYTSRKQKYLNKNTLEQKECTFVIK